MFSTGIKDCQIFFFFFKFSISLHGSKTFGVLCIFNINLLDSESSLQGLNWSVGQSLNFLGGGRRGGTLMNSPLSWPLFPSSHLPLCQLSWEKERHCFCWGYWRRFSRPPPQILSSFWSKWWTEHNTYLCA